MSKGNEQENTKKKKKGGSLNLVILISALAVMAFSLYNLVPILWDYYHADKTYAVLADDYVQVPDQPEEDTSAEEEVVDNAWRDVVIDFDALHQINSDVVGWIRFDDQDELPIDYPILYSGDNDKYLRTDLYGNTHTAGSIFLEGANASDFSDYHTILYGHNMKNMSMFGSLKKYRNEENFWKSHQYFTIYTENTVYRYQIFSYHHVEDTSNYYTVGFGPGEELQTFIDRMVSDSMYNTGITPTGEDHIVTLSTCTSAGDEYRFVIHAVCVEELSVGDEAQ